MMNFTTAEAKIRSERRESRVFAAEPVAAPTLAVTAPVLRYGPPMQTAEPPLPPLAELHRHLDGSLRPATLAELASEHGKTIPDDLGFRAGMGLDEALARFAVTLSVLQTPDAVARVAREICEDAAAEGITTLEIRFAPQLHLGAPIETIVDAALAGVSGRAGLILCGLYGESPSVLSALVDAAADRHGVVGIDLAGGPNPTHESRMEDYAEVFTRARELGLGITVHAGEGRPPGEIRTAIEVLGARRIGHGTSLLDDPEVADLVVERGITIEACPTSNVHTGAIANLADHPIRRWLARGIKVCVCTDNTLLSETDLPDEYARIRRAAGLSRIEVETCIAAGHAARFRR